MTRREEHDKPEPTHQYAQDNPAETLDALERQVLGHRPEDVRNAHDTTEQNSAPAYEQDLGTDDLAGSGAAQPPEEPPS